MDSFPSICKYAIKIVAHYFTVLQLKPILHTAAQLTLVSQLFEDNKLYQERPINFTAVSVYRLSEKVLKCYYNFEKSNDDFWIFFKPLSIIFYKSFYV